MGDRSVILITGATGFLGGHVIRRLGDAGHHIVSLVRDWTSQRPPHHVVEVRGDVRDHDTIYRVLHDYGCTHVVHLAAQSIVPVAMGSRLETFDVNVRGTYALLEACRRYAKLAGVIVASSDKALGSQPPPYVEEMWPNGVYPYDASKACAELIARSYATTDGLPVAVIRMANMYGPGDRNITRIVPYTIRQALRGEPVEIRSDGTPVRDYVFVDDVARGIVLLLGYLPQYAGQTFHFGTNKGISVITLVRMILALTNPVPIRILGVAQGELDAQYVSAEKAKRLLGWEPTTPLDAGLQTTVTWWKEARP